MDRNLSLIKERIIVFLENQKIKKENFFKLTGISPSNFKGVGAKSELGGDKIVKILSIYKNLNPDWLLTGEGKMLRQPGSDGCGDDAVKRAEQLAAENEELRTQLELQKKLLEAKDETIEALQRAVRLLEKQEKVTETRTEVVEGVVGRKA